MCGFGFNTLLVFLSVLILSLSLSLFLSLYIVNLFLSITILHKICYVPFHRAHNFPNTRQTDSRLFLSGTNNSQSPQYTKHNVFSLILNTKNPRSMFNDLVHEHICFDSGLFVLFHYYAVWWPLGALHTLTWSLRASCILTGCLNGSSVGSLDILD